jgi:hypothetical protein
VKTDPVGPLDFLLRAGLGVLGAGALFVAGVWIKEVELEPEPGAWWVPAIFLISGAVTLRAALSGRAASTRVAGLVAATVAIGALVYLAIGLSRLS